MQNIDSQIEIKRGGRKTSYLAGITAFLIKALSLTLRHRIIDHAQLTTLPKDQPLIFLLWHNSILTIPTLRRKHFRCRQKMTVLTSASKDGTFLEKTVRRFGLEAIRGSSSRRAISALIAMRKAIQNGHDLVITPDGPRGPRHQIQPGALKLATITNAPLISLQVHYHKSWKLSTWDRFQIPYPFSKVTLTIHPPFHLKEKDSTENAQQLLTQQLGH